MVPKRTRAAARKKSKQTCMHPGCDRPTDSRGHCKRHIRVVRQEIAKGNTEEALTAIHHRELELKRATHLCDARAAAFRAFTVVVTPPA